MNGNHMKQSIVVHRVVFMFIVLYFIALYFIESQSIVLCFAEWSVVCLGVDSTLRTFIWRCVPGRRRAVSRPLLTWETSTSQRLIASIAQDKCPWSWRVTTVIGWPQGRAGWWVEKRRDETGFRDVECLIPNWISQVCWNDGWIVERWVDGWRERWGIVT